jgi:hypothetical protein
LYLKKKKKSKRIHINKKNENIKKNSSEVEALVSNLKVTDIQILNYWVRNALCFRDYLNLVIEQLTQSLNSIFSFHMYVNLL